MANPEKVSVFCLREKEATNTFRYGTANGAPDNTFATVYLPKTWEGVNAVRVTIEPAESGKLVPLVRTNGVKSDKKSKGKSKPVPTDTDTLGAILAALEKLAK